MEAIIIAGGQGTRLSKLTREIPKPMIPINGKPILEYQIEEFRASGIKDIVLTVGYLREVIKDYFGNGEKFGVNIHYVEEETPLGSAGAFYKAKDYVTDTALVVYGDVLFSIDIDRMLNWHRQRGAAATLLAHPNSHPHDSDIVLHDDNFYVTGFLRKKQDRAGMFFHNCVNAGFFVVEKEAFSYFKRPEKLDFEKDFLYSLVKNKQVSIYQSTEYIKDMGTYERLETVEANFRNGIVQQRNLKNPQKCIFLDRDGTLNALQGFIDHAEQLELLPNVAEAVKMINESGYLAVIVTNQPVVARGMCTLAELDQIHMKLEMLLGEQGAYIDKLYFCPHHPDKGFVGERPEYKIHCDCRKPGTALIEQAVNDLHIDLTKSWFIGDSTRDIQTGKNIGIKTILLRTGEAGKDGKYDAVPDFIAEDLLTAVKFVLNQE